MRKLILLVLFLAATGCIVWLYLTAQQRPGRRGNAASAVAVEIALVKSSDLSDRAVFTGSIRANERIDAAAKFNEIVREIYVDAGDFVERGDLLARLNDEQYVLDVEQAEANLAVAKANANDANQQLEITLRDIERARRLRDETVISAQEFDRYAATHQTQQAKYEVAAAQVNLAETALRTVKVRLGNTRILAEWTGGADRRLVARRHIDAGSLARTNDPVVTIIDIVTVKAVITVSEREYSKMTIGYPVSVTTDAFPNRKFQGKVKRISQELGDLAREAEVEVEIDNADLALKPGMFIRAEVEFARSNNAIATPIESIVRRQDGSRGVFVIDREANKVTYHPIVEGIQDSGLVELLTGDNLLGCEVVVMGQHLLNDGSTIIVAKES